MPDFDEDDDGEGAFGRTYGQELVRHDIKLAGGAFDRIYELGLEHDIKLAQLELNFKAQLESRMNAVLDLLRGQQLVEPREKPGPKPDVFERVKAEMHESIRERGVEYLRDMKQELMKEIYKASPSTCWRAKRAVLSELSSINCDC